METQLAAARGRVARTERENKWPGHLMAWRASVWDEVHATANGTLSRRIKILITDGTQSEPDEAA